MLAPFFQLIICWAWSFCRPKASPERDAQYPLPAIHYSTCLLFQKQSPSLKHPRLQIELCQVTKIVSSSSQIRWFCLLVSYSSCLPYPFFPFLVGRFSCVRVHPLILVLGPGVFVSAHYLSWWSCCAWVTFSELLLPSLVPKKVREARCLSNKAIFVCLRVVMCFGCLNGILIMFRWLAGSLEVTLCGFSALHAWNSGGELIFSPKRVRLAQARISKARLRFCLECSPRRPIQVSATPRLAQARWTHLSESS